MSNIYTLKLVVRGGCPIPPAILAPRVSPFRMPPKKVSDVIQEGTKDWKGIRVPVIVTVDTTNMPPSISVEADFSASALIVRALGSPWPRAKGYQHDGTLDFATVLEISKKMQAKSFATSFANVVTQVLGTCRSIGCSVRVDEDVLAPQDVSDMIRAGELECPEPEE